MATSAERPDPVEAALRRARAARASAVRVTAIADRLERDAAQATAGLATILRNTAARQRESEHRFRAVADLHQRHAQRLAEARPPAADPFMMAVADLLREPSTGLILLDSRHIPLATTASDALARAALDLEVSLGQGPAHDGARRSDVSPVLVRDLVQRWPIYGPELASLGIRTVAAAPVRIADDCAGALTAFGSTTAPRHDVLDRLRTLVAGLTDTVRTPMDLAVDVGLSNLEPLLEESDARPVVHQAAGFLSTQLGVPIADAYAVLRARAFVDGEPVNTVADRVVRRETLIGPEFD